MTSNPEENEETTRICIKNVPPSYTELKLKSHLISKSLEPLTITDCKILRTKDGISRKLAFIGFKDVNVSHLHSYYAHKFANNKYAHFLLSLRVDGQSCNSIF